MRQRIVNVLFVSLFAAMLGAGIIAPLMPIYAESFGATGIWLGIVLSGFSLSRAIFMPIIGRIADKGGRKRFIAFGLLLYSTISLLYTLAGNIFYLTVIRLIHGFASAMVIPIAMAYVGETTERGGEGSSMGTLNVALFLGWGAGPFLGGLLNDEFGIASAFYAMSGFAAIAFMIAFFFLPDAMYTEVRGETISFESIISNNTIKGLLLYRATNAVGRSGVISFLPILVSRMGMTSSQVAIILSANIFVTAILQRPFGSLADRFNRYYLVLIGSAVGALALLLIPLGRNFEELFLINTFMGICGAIALPSATAMTVLVGQRVGMGASMGIFGTAMSIGMIAGPLISGVVMDTLGLASVFYVVGMMSLLGTFAFCHYLRTGLRSHEEGCYQK